MGRSKCRWMKVRYFHFFIGQHTRQLLIGIVSKGWIESNVSILGWFPRIQFENNTVLILLVNMIQIFTFCREALKIHALYFSVRTSDLCKCSLTARFIISGIWTRSCRSSPPQSHLLSRLPAAWHLDVGRFNFLHVSDLVKIRLWWWSRFRTLALFRPISRLVSLNHILLLSDQRRRT